MAKKKINILKYCKNIGITTGAIAGVITIVKMASVIIELPARMSKVDTQLEMVNINLDRVETKVDSLSYKVNNQGSQIQNLTNSYSEFLKNNPTITKEDLIRYLTPIYEEVKKNEYMTQSSAHEKGAS